jgi:hypothetical protein
MIEKVVQVFGSFAEHEAATRRYYASLAPQKRLDILLEMVFGEDAECDESAQRLERVYRIVKLGEC